MNILIVKLSAIGDVVHTLPSLSALRKLYPHAHIAWVIEEAASDLIKDHPCLDCVIVSRRKRWVQELKKGQLPVLKEIIEFIRTLRGIRYDLVIDFQGLLKSSVIVFLARAKRKLGYKSMQAGGSMRRLHKLVRRLMEQDRQCNEEKVKRNMFCNVMGASESVSEAPEERSAKRRILYVANLPR